MSLQTAADAVRILDEILERDPDLFKEWEKTFLDTMRYKVGREHPLSDSESEALERLRGRLDKPHGYATPKA